MVSATVAGVGVDGVAVHMQVADRRPRDEVHGVVRIARTAEHRHIGDTQRANGTASQLDADARRLLRPSFDGDHFATADPDASTRERIERNTPLEAADKGEVDSSILSGSTIQTPMISDRIAMAAMARSAPWRAGRHAPRDKLAPGSVAPGMVRGAGLG
jgi:hypothetical protein